MAHGIIILKLVEENYIKAFHALYPVNLPDKYRTFNIESHPCFHKAIEAFKHFALLVASGGRSQDGEKIVVLSDDQQQRVLEQPDMQPDHPQGLAYLVTWGCMLWHGIRHGSIEVYDVRRGELTVVFDLGTLQHAPNVSDTRRPCIRRPALPQRSRKGAGLLMQLTTSSRSRGMLHGQTSCICTTLSCHLHVIVLSTTVCLLTCS